MEAEVMVKRVIDGRAYNTDTSELIAIDPTGGNGPGGLRIYRTRQGAFFEVWTEEDESPRMNPLTREKARAILTGEDTDYSRLEFNIMGEVDDLLGDVPEASSEEQEAGQSVIFFRVSKQFKASIEAMAKAAGMSVNAWLLRAVEAEMSTPKIHRDSEKAELPKPQERTPLPNQG